MLTRPCEVRPASLRPPKASLSVSRTQEPTLCVCVSCFSSVRWLSCVRLFATPWTVAYQAPASMEFSRQGYWSGLPFPSLGTSLTLQALPTECLLCAGTPVSLAAQSTSPCWSCLPAGSWRYLAKVSVAQLCPTLCDTMDSSPPGSSIHGIFQARVLEWVAIYFNLKKDK